MGKTLLMFPMSENMDLTINFMSCAIDRFEISQIVFIKILHPFSQNIGEVISKEDENIEPKKSFKHQVEDTIELLSNGKYIREKKEYDVSAGMDYYKRLKDIYFKSNASETIDYAILEDEIKRLSNRYGVDSIVDVTGTPKRIAINILAACLSVGIQKVMIFELKNNPNKNSEGIDALYHAVRASNDYEFVDLSKENPALRNIANYSEKGNVKRLWGAMIAIVISLGLTIVNQWGSFTSGKGDWIFALIICIGLIGSMVTILDDLVGGIISAIFDQKK